MDPALMGRNLPLLYRATFFVGLWIVLTGPDWAAVPVGIVVALAAAKASLHLLPPRPGGGLHLASLLRFIGHFLVQSARGGWDVAWRAFHPRLPLRPGLREVRVHLHDAARLTLAGELSLLPGTLAVRQESGVILLHCLDCGSPVQEQTDVEQALLARIWSSGGRRDG